MIWKGSVVFIQYLIYQAENMGSTEYNCTAVLFEYRYHDSFLNFYCFSVPRYFLLHFTRYFDRYFFSNLIFSTLHLVMVKFVLYCLDSLMYVFFLSSSQRSTSHVKCKRADLGKNGGIAYH